LTACGSPPAKISPMLENAVNYNLQGKQFFQNRDYENALVSYNKALQIDKSIENADGVALNLLNIAQAHIALNQSDAAHASLDEVIGNTTGLFQADQLAQAAVQKSLIFISQGQSKSTGEWINKADALCGDSCHQKGLILNIQARFALDERQPDAAIDLANRALAAHKKEMLVSEMANSLRLIGEAHLGKQLPGKAIPFLQEALQLDKSQGLPVKISTDLLLLGMAHKDSKDQSALFFRRAIAVSRAAGDLAGEQRASHALDSLAAPDK
jgi:tetratricopeptide (TPR) repeat protein